MLPGSGQGRSHMLTSVKEQKHTQKHTMIGVRLIECFVLLFASHGVTFKM